MLRRGRTFLLASLILLLALPLAAPPVQAAAKGDDLPTLSADQQAALLELLIGQLTRRIEPEGGVCNGGSCQPNPNSTTTLNCPTSGGPTCTSGQSCFCSCASQYNGGFSAVNNCKTNN